MIAGDKTFNAVIYARVSTDLDKQVGSIPTQIARCQSYCEALGWNIVEVCSDQGITGTTLDRPGWHRVESLVKSGRANMVLATCLDRLTRTDEFMPWLREVLHPANADFATIDERIDTSNAAGRLALGILVQIAQFQAEQTREKTAAAMKSRAERGLWVTKLPFGTKLGSEKGVPVKDPETWPWVEYIYDQAASGISRANILSHLADKGVKGPSGGEFGRTTLDRILSNRFYLGKVYHNGDEYPAKHKCLVEIDLWERVQTQTPGHSGPKPKRADYLFRGKVYTDQLEITYPEDRAGGPVPLVPYFSKGRNNEFPSYYRADKRRKYGGLKAKVVDYESTEWLPSSVPANDLDEAVIDALIEMAGKNQRQVFVCRAETAAESMKGDTLERMQVKEKELSALRKRIGKFIDMTVEKGPTASDKLIEKWNRQLAELDDSEQVLIGEVQGCADILKRLEQTTLETEAVIDQVNAIEEYWKARNLEKLGEIIDLIVESVNVRATDESFEVSVKLYPLPIIREVFESTPIEKKAALPYRFSYPFDYPVEKIAVGVG